MSVENTGFPEALARLALRASGPGYDPRHAVLDVAPELLAIGPGTVDLPQHLAAELREVLAEFRAVLPPYPSRRHTSPLFDRAGLGRVGYDRAERLVGRLAALAKAVRKADLKAT